MSPGLRLLARWVTAVAVVAAYLSLHFAITVCQDVQARDRFRDGPGHAAAFTLVTDRYAGADASARAEVTALRDWFEAHAPAGRSRETVRATAELLAAGELSAARERVVPLGADVARDGVALERHLDSFEQATLWPAVVAGALVAPMVRLRRRRITAGEELVRVVNRFAARQPRWRRPVFLSVTWTGYALFLAGAGSVANAQQRGEEHSLGVQLLLLPIGLVAVGAGLLILRYSRPRSARGAARALRADGRKPVLYLRSFADDRSAMAVDDAMGFTIHSREEQLAASLKAFGPVIAVGRPGEPLPHLGAARFYLPLDDWKPTVLRLMDLSRLIVLRVGAGEGLRWEIERAFATQPPHRIVLLTPGRTADAERSLDGLMPVPMRLAEVAADTTWVSAAVAFDPEWVPQVRAVEPAPGTLPRPGFLRRALKAAAPLVWEPSPARLTGRAMKAALASVGVRGRLVVWRSDSTMFVVWWRGVLVLAALALPFRVLDLLGVR
ncbi:hypothetical protein GCM10020229_63520 [Kitasatospora albolonga]|uniref:transferase n=1 Tax=Kitasatospora albolonga TaxID=68173 RepID=UPI0031EF09C3